MDKDNHDLWRKDGLRWVTSHVSQQTNDETVSDVARSTYLLEKAFSALAFGSNFESLDSCRGLYFIRSLNNLAKRCSKGTRGAVYIYKP